MIDRPSKERMGRGGSRNRDGNQQNEEDKDRMSIRRRGSQEGEEVCQSGQVG